MIKLVTSSYEWWRRSWIMIARECEVLVSRSTIERVFKKAEYERYSSRQKSYLIVIMKMKRLNWCKDKEFWDVISRQKWDRVIYMNETSVKLRELQSLIHVTRTKEEEWESDCCEKIFFEYTTFMFWDSIALNWKSSCYIYQLKNKKNREVFISVLAVENLLRRSIKQTAHAENKMNCLQQDLKTFSFRFSLCCHFKREEIDWYKYNRGDLWFLLLSVYHRFLITHCSMSTTLVMQNEVFCHISQWQKSLFAK